jgi:hypothetical protein
MEVRFMAVSVSGAIATILNIIQQNVLERQFHDALFPALLYRADATAEAIEAHLGEVKIMSRDGLLAVIGDPLVPGTDPTPQNYAREQWVVEMDQWGGTTDTHMPTSSVALADQVLRDAHAIGLQAGQTVNRRVRNRLFQAYLSGNTNATVLQAIGAVTIHVASLNGFTENLLNGRPTAVSAANPVTITFAGAEPANTVTAAVPDNPLLPFGPGTLTLGAALTAGIAAREGVYAQNRAVIYRVGGGATVDAIGAADVLQFTDISNAVAQLEANNNMRHGDGYFHHHLSPVAKAQVYTDNAWQRLHESLPQGLAYSQFAMGVSLGAVHYMNTESPDDTNTGTLVSSGAGASFSSSDLGADVINNAGIHIGRTIITARDSCYEEYIPEERYISEAGVTGKVGNFSIINNGVAIMTERIRYTLRSPLDRLQQVLAHTWSWSGDFGIPSDQETGGNARFKRSIVLEHALG